MADISHNPKSDQIELSNNPQLLKSCSIHNINYQKTRPYPLNDISDLNLQQALIIKDLLFVLLGHEGNYIRFSERYDPSNMDLRIKGPDFKIAKHLDMSLKLITKKIVKFGKLYCALTSFAEVYNIEAFGRVIQRLCYALSEFRERYESLLLDIEVQFKTNSMFNLSILENILLKEIANPMNHFYEIISIIHHETKERQTNFLHSGENYFNNFIDYLKNDLKQTNNIDLSTDIEKFNVCKGSLALQIIQSRINVYKGDSVSSNFLVKLFQDCGVEYLNSLNKWLTDGIIDDPFEEFLIKESKFPDNFNHLLSVNTEKYWDELYMCRNDGLIDQFQSKDIQIKILLTGKYLNIFKYCTGLENFEELNEDLVPIKSFFGQDFELRINNFYKRANKFLMKLLIEGYNFKSVINYLLDKFLLRNSFNIDKFIDSNFNDLQKNKYKISVTKLLNSFNNLMKADDSFFDNKLDFSIDSSNLFELAKEILNVKSFDAEEALKNNSNTFKELLNKSLEKNSSDNTSLTNYDPDNSDEYTILGVNIDLNLPFPLNLIVNQSYNFEYQLIFKVQILVKFISQLVDKTWNEINCTTVWKYRAFDGKIKKWVLRSKILHNRIKDFMNIFQYYLNYDIIDTNVTELEKYLINVEEVLRNKPLEAVEQVEYSLMRGIPINYNGLFSDKLFENKETPEVEDLTDFDTLTNKIGTFLNNILRDSFMTNTNLISVLKKLFDVIILYCHFLMRLKKSLIMMNNDLFSEFHDNYPDKFQDKEVNDALIQNRYNSLNEMLNYNYELFNNSLTEFMVLIKNIGDIENRLFLMLIEKLEQCFPDH